MADSHLARRRASIISNRAADERRHGHPYAEAQARAVLLLDIQDALDDRTLMASEGLAAVGRDGDVSTLYGGGIATEDLRAIRDALRALPGACHRFLAA